MNNTRFATSVHILTLMHYYKGELLSSEYIAGSININPVIVRKEISNLRQHGFIESKEGKGGGSTLSKPAKDILLSDVYNAVQQNLLLGKKNDPNPECVVGKQINQHLNNLYSEVEDVLLKKLNKTTLADFAKQFK